MQSFLAVFTKSFKQLWKDKIMVGVMVIFPLVLIFVLGNALGGFIEGNHDFDGERLQIAVVADENSPFVEFLKSDEISHFIEANLVENKDCALYLLEEHEIFLIAAEINGEISITIPQTANINGLIALSIIDSYNQIGSAMTIAMLEGGNFEELTTILEANIAITQAPLGIRTPSGIDFFAVTMLVMIMLFAGFNGVELFNKAMLSHTGSRMMITPVSKPILITGLITAATVVSFVQGFITMAFTHFAYGVFWGDNWGIALLTLLGVVLFSNAFAILLLVSLKNVSSANAAFQVLIFVMTFMAGGFGAPVNFGESFERAIRFIPSNLAQTVLFTNAFGGNEQTMFTNLAILFGIGITLLAAAFIVGRRRLA